MDAIVSSFCFTKNTLGAESSFFHRLPPVCFRTWRRFVPDYSILFLCDRFYVDAEAADRVSREPLFAKHKEMLDALSKCGRLEVRDFRKEISPYMDDIRRYTALRTRRVHDWAETFERVIEEWERFHTNVEQNYEPLWTEEERTAAEKDDNAYWEGQESWPDERWLLDTLAGGMYEGLDPGLIDVLSRWDFASRDERLRVESLIRGYVEHVAANLCLSDVLNATVHDWQDIGPVYEATFADTLRVEDAKDSEKQHKVSQLLSVMFPEFEPKNADSLAKTLDDRRVEAVRSIVSKAVDEGTEFDVAFANATLREVLKAEAQIDRLRNIIGWVTKPLGFIPYVGWAVDTLADKGLGSLVDKREKRKLSWFYFLSEINA